MVKLVINKFLWLWSHFPICSLSDDNNFATLSLDNENEKKIRFSIINLMLGDVIIYLFTLNIKERKFKWIHVLKLPQLPNFEITNEKLSELESAYYQHMSLLQSEELNIEYVSLCNHVQCEENRISTSENKINMYMTIMLTVIPLLVAIVDINQVKELSILAKLSIAIVIYTILNIGFYLFRIMKVKKFKLSKFGELKESSDKVKMQNWQMYNDWQNLKSKADLYVSYILNVEEWIKFLAIIGVLLACIFSINPNWICTQKNMQVQQTKSYVCVVQVDEISDVYSESSRNWNAVLMDLSQNKFSNVIVLYKDDVDIDEIQIVLSEYSKQKIDYIKDKSLTSKSVKLIMED